MNMKYLLILLLAVACISCDREKSAENGGIPMDSSSVLYRITDLTGLVESGDELVAMTYPQDSREARIRQENIDLAEFSLLDTRSEIALEKQGEHRLVKIPDLKDETGSRFFYFERSSDDALVFRGVCAGPWRKDRKFDSSLAVCNITYVLGDSIVSFEVSERDFIAHGGAIAKRVLAVVRAKQ